MFSSVVFARAIRVQALTVTALLGLLGTSSAFAQEFPAKILSATCDQEAGFRADEILGEVVPGANKGRVRCAVQFKATPYLIVGPLPPGYVPPSAPTILMNQVVQISFNREQFNRTTKPSVSINKIPGGDASQGASRVVAVEDRPGVFDVKVPSESTATLYFNLEPVVDFFPREKDPVKVVVSIDKQKVELSPKLYKKDVANFLLRLEGAGLAAVASGSTAQRLDAQALKAVTDRTSIATDIKLTEQRLLQALALVNRESVQYKDAAASLKNKENKLKALNDSITRASSDARKLQDDITVKEGLIERNSKSIPSLRADINRINASIAEKDRMIQTIANSISQKYSFYNSVVSGGYDYNLLISLQDQINQLQRQRAAVTAEKTTFINNRNRVVDQVKKLDAEISTAKTTIVNNGAKRAELLKNRDKAQVLAKNLEKELPAERAAAGTAKGKLDAAIAKFEPILAQVAENQVKLDASTTKLLASLKP